MAFRPIDVFAQTLHEALGLAEQDQIVGFLYLGTPATAFASANAGGDSADFVRWL